MTNVGHFFKIPPLQLVLEQTGLRVLEAITGLARRLPEGGKAMVVSHGGTIIPAANLVKPLDFHKLKRIPECGGISFFADGNRVVGYEIFNPAV